jgi:hypothetical protein
LEWSSPQCSVTSFLNTCGAGGSSTPDEPQHRRFSTIQRRAKMLAMDLQYPIGKFQWSGANTPEQRARFIEDIAAAPQRMRSAVAGLTDEQLNTPYRDGGWTVRQVVHHLPDSHMNSYIRFKFALTEHEPTIKPYDEAVWAELIDGKTAPIEPSLNLLDGLHYRWALLLKSLSDEDVKRKFTHPELGVVSIDQYIALYAWHSRHHVAHITSLRERKAWQ